MPRVDPSVVTAAVESARADLDVARTELEDLVRIPSISADPDRVRDVSASADAVAALMEAAGLEHVRQASVDGSPPCVIGDWLHAPDAPTILLYAHHDVQPPGYAERWSGDPFEPWERDGRLYGRGSADDKAGVLAHVGAVRAWLRTAGELPCNVKVMVEGEEEIGSPRLAPFLAEFGDDLQADVLLLADAGNWSVGTPGVTYSLRGIAGGTVRLRALESPLHSGMAGGANAILIPEVNFDLDEVIGWVESRFKASYAPIIVVAEGAIPADGDLITKDASRDSFGHVKLSGIGEWLAQQVEARTGHEARTTVLGHIQRGGSPCAFDRELATRFGVKAVELIAEGKFGHVAAVENGHLVAKPMEKAVKKLKLVDPAGELIRAAKGIGIEFGG